MIRQNPGFVDHKGVGKTGDLVMRHVGKESVGIGIRKLPMLGKAFLEVAPLNVMKTACVPAVVAGVNATMCIEFDAKRVATTFGENLVLPLLRVVTPNELSD